MLHLIYTESRSGGQVCDGDEGESWPNFEDENIDWNASGVSLTTQQYDGKLVADFNPQVGQKVYIPFVRYYDGGTCGYWAVWEAFMDKYAAEENLKKVLNKKWPQHWPYPSWTGYFGGLQDSGVIEFVVEK